MRAQFLKTSKRKYFCFALMLTIAMYFDMPHYLHEFYIKTQQWLCSGASLTYVVIAILGKHFVWKLLDNILHACSFKRLFFAIIFIRFMYKRPMTMSNKKHDYRLFLAFLPWNTMVAVFSLLMCCVYFCENYGAVIQVSSSLLPSPSKLEYLNPKHFGVHE